MVSDTRLRWCLTPASGPHDAGPTPDHFTVTVTVRVTVPVFVDADSVYVVVAFGVTAIDPLNGTDPTP